MSLAEDINESAMRVLAALDAAHDYYAYSRAVWRMMHDDVIKHGRELSIQNTVTGNRVDEQALLGLIQPYTTEYLAASTFQYFVSLFEDFLFDVLRLWLMEYPQRLGRKQIDVASILEAPDKQAILALAVDKELNEIKYRRVEDWFRYLNDLVRLDVPSREVIQQIAEIKASRDILIHNQGVVNQTYLAKAGGRARYGLDEKLEIRDPYHRQSWQTLRTAIQDIAGAASAKAGGT